MMHFVPDLVHLHKIPDDPPGAFAPYDTYPADRGCIPPTGGVVIGGQRQRLQRRRSRGTGGAGYRPRNRAGF